MEIISFSVTCMVHILPQCKAKTSVLHKSFNFPLFESQKKNISRALISSFQQSASGYWVTILMSHSLTPGAALLAHPGEDATGDIIVVSAPRCTLLRTTEELGLCKTYSNGDMEAFSYDDREKFKDSGKLCKTTCNNVCLCMHVDIQRTVHPRLNTTYISTYLLCYVFILFLWCKLSSNGYIRCRCNTSTFSRRSHFGCGAYKCGKKIQQSALMYLSKNHELPTQNNLPMFTSLSTCGS